MIAKAEELEEIAKEIWQEKHAALLWTMDFVKMSVKSVQFGERQFATSVTFEIRIS